MNSGIVFFGSFVLSVIALLMERLIGIGWDYHFDCVTYATLSKETVSIILEKNPMQIFNNGYYFVVAFLDENIIIVTLMNMLLYSYTNVLLFKFHRSLLPYAKGLTFLLLVLNPYRLHLSTTMLKDTLIIFFVVLSAGSIRGYVKVLLALMILRLASLFYAISLFRGKRIFYIAGVCVPVFIYFNESIIAFILQSNDYVMVLRGFDLIPTFQEYGVVGICLRAVIWAFLAVTGLFVVLSPALEYFPVALGSLFNQIYCYRMSGRFQMPLGVLLVLMLFAVLAPGFTAYIRYVYPVLVILPMIALLDKKHEASLLFSVAAYKRKQLNHCFLETRKLGSK